jgi:hypothetical protein
MVLLPLTYSTLLYLVTNNIATLGTIALVSVLIAGVATAVVASLNILGSGLNAAGTIMVFVLLFGGLFYGVSVSGLMTSQSGTNNGVSGPNPWNPPFASSTTSPSNANIVGGANSLSGIDYPYKSIVDILFGIIYALGLYLLISDRSGD